MWIAVFVSALLVAVPAPAETIVDAQVQLDSDEVAPIEVVLPLLQAPTSRAVPVACDATPSPTPGRGRVFRPPRLRFG